MAIPLGGKQQREQQLTDHKIGREYFKMAADERRKDEMHDVKMTEAMMKLHHGHAKNQLELEQLDDDHSTAFQRKSQEHKAKMTQNYGSGTYEVQGMHHGGFAEKKVLRDIDARMAQHPPVPQGYFAGEDEIPMIDGYKCGTGHVKGYESGSSIVVPTSTRVPSVTMNWGFEKGSKSVPRTHDNYPAVYDPESGGYMTEYSMTVTDPRLNKGRPTNIPSLWQMQVRDEDQSVANALAHGGPYPSYQSIPQAEAAARAKSVAGGAQAGYSYGVPGIPAQHPGMSTGMIPQNPEAGPSDTVPAMLTPGEAVIPREAAQHPKYKKQIAKMIDHGRKIQDKKKYGHGTHFAGYSEGVYNVPGYVRGVASAPDTDESSLYVPMPVTGVADVSSIDPNTMLPIPQQGYNWASPANQTAMTRIEHAPAQTPQQAVARAITQNPTDQVTRAQNMGKIQDATAPEFDVPDYRQQVIAAEQAIPQEVPYYGGTQKEVPTDELGQPLYPQQAVPSVGANLMTADEQAQPSYPSAEVPPVGVNLMTADVAPPVTSTAKVEQELKAHPLGQEVWGAVKEAGKELGYGKGELLKFALLALGSRALGYNTTQAVRHAFRTVDIQAQEKQKEAFQLEKLDKMEAARDKRQAAQLEGALAKQQIAVDAANAKQEARLEAREVENRRKNINSYARKLIDEYEMQPGDASTVAKAEQHFIDNGVYPQGYDPEVFKRIQKGRAAATAKAQAARADAGEGVGAKSQGPDIVVSDRETNREQTYTTLQGKDGQMWVQTPKGNIPYSTFHSLHDQSRYSIDKRDASNDPVAIEARFQKQVDRLLDEIPKTTKSGLFGTETKRDINKGEIELKARVFAKQHNIPLGSAQFENALVDAVQLMRQGKYEVSGDGIMGALYATVIRNATPKDRDYWGTEATKPEGMGTRGETMSNIGKKILDGANSQSIRDAYARTHTNAPKTTPEGYTKFVYENLKNEFNQLDPKVKKQWEERANTSKWKEAGVTPWMLYVQDRK